LIAEIARVVKGPLYIKDHLALGRLDDLRLAILDFLGNTPFHGMVRADYLTAREWRDLAEHGGYRICEAPRRRYRGGPFAMLFPNRLEMVMKWAPGGQNGK
jgi:hypothetical protein